MISISSSTIVTVALTVVSSSALIDLGKRKARIRISLFILCPVLWCERGKFGANGLVV